MSAQGCSPRAGSTARYPLPVSQSWFFTHRSGVSPQKDGLHQPGYPFLSLSLHDHALWERRGTAQALKRHTVPQHQLCPLVLKKSGSLMQIFSTSSTATVVSWIQKDKVSLALTEVKILLFQPYHPRASSDCCDIFPVPFTIHF